VWSGLALAAALVAAVVLALPGSAQAATARATALSRPDPGSGSVYVCLYYDHSRCAMPKNHSLSDGTRVLLSNRSTKTHPTWSESPMIPGVCAGQHNSVCQGHYTPFTNHKLDREFYRDTVYVYAIQNATRSVCMEGFGGQVKLESNCGNASPSTTWVRAGKELINVQRTNFEGVVSVLHADSARNGLALNVLPAGDARGYERWAIIS